MLIRALRLSTARAFPALLAAAVLLAAQVKTQAAVLVYLDFTDFSARLNNASSAAGESNFNGTRKTQIQADITKLLESVYGGFGSGITFVQGSAPAGDHETITFGTTNPNPGVQLGQSIYTDPVHSDITLRVGETTNTPTIDWLNQNKNGTAAVYTADLGLDSGFITGNNDAAATTVARALTNLAAHQVGHLLGLLHQDSYGDRDVVENNTFNSISQGNNEWPTGEQNNHIMASGSVNGYTGTYTAGVATAPTDNTLAQQALPASIYTSQMSLGEYSYAKLSYADGLLSTPLPVLDETGVAWDAHLTRQTAIALIQNDMPVFPIQDMQTALVHGRITNNGNANGDEVEADWYKFTTVRAGVVVNVEMLSDSIYLDRVNADLILYNTNGTTALETRNSQLGYAGQFGDREPSPPHSFDRKIINETLGAAGTYYIRVITQGVGVQEPDIGDYDLFVTLAGNVVPEPSSWALACVGLVGLGLVQYRRRRKGEPSPQDVA